MDAIEREILFNRARSWVLQAGKLIRDRMDDPLTVSIKSNPKDLVTELDKEIEYFFATNIKRFYPDHLLLGEEGYGDTTINKKKTVWIVDPIDGTMNFIHQKQNFAIAIGIYNRGIGEIGYIYDVMNNMLYSALRNNGAYRNNIKLPPLSHNKLLLKESMVSFSHRWLIKNKFINEKIMQQLVHDVRGVRAYGSAALGFARVAEGALQAYITMNLEPWDIAAGQIIVNEVGGLTTDITGGAIQFLENSSVITAHPFVHDLLVSTYLKKAIK